MNGVPPDANLFDLSDFEGFNTQDTRSQIKDQEFSWLENFLPIGPGNLRTLYGASRPIYRVSSFLLLEVVQDGYVLQEQDPNPPDTFRIELEEGNP